MFPQGIRKVIYATSAVASSPAAFNGLQAGCQPAAGCHPAPRAASDSTFMLHSRFTTPKAGAFGRSHNHRGSHWFRCIGVCALALLAVARPAIAAGYLRRTFTTEDGLPSNVVNDVLQTQDGFLIVGAANGLVRVVGDGTNHWPLIYDRDLADLYARLVARDDASGVYHAND